jgi:hypothetical protein
MGQHCMQLSSKVMGSLLHMDIHGFMRDLKGLNRYMIVYERIVTIGISVTSVKVESRRQVAKGTT